MGFCMPDCAEVVTGERTAAAQIVAAIMFIVINSSCNDVGYLSKLSIVRRIATRRSSRPSSRSRRSILAPSLLAEAGRGVSP